MSIKKSKSQTNDLQKVAALEEKLKRSLADYSNLEKRIESQRQVLFTLAATTIISHMIDVLDDLYLAQKHLKDQGLQIAIDKFKNVLHAQGLDEINPEDKEFNPATMDCIEVVNGKQDYVVEVKKKGYVLNDRVIRPAAVVVGREINNSSSN